MGNCMRGCIIRSFPPHQRKNCEPLVFGPAFAIDSVPAAVCLAMGHKVIVLQAALLYMCDYPQYEDP